MLHTLKSSFAPALRAASSNSLFRLTLVVKVAFIVLFIPVVQSTWFVPFVVNAISHPGLDPWSSYVMLGGDANSFPYGPVMLLMHLPTTMVGWFIDQALHRDYFAGLGFRFSLLASDVALLGILLAMYERYEREIVLFYWASPLVFYITYWHGQTDIIPVLFFVASFFFVRQRSYAVAGGTLALAVAAKHSMLIAVPFILIYLWLRRGLGAKVWVFAAWFAGLGLLLEGPLLFSPGFHDLVLDNKEAAKLLWLAVPMGGHGDLYVTVLAYLLLLHYLWRMRRVDGELLWAAMGVAFGVIILMTPASPGWFLWLAPVLAIHQSRKGGSAVILAWAFSAVFILYNILNATGASFAFVPSPQSLEWQGSIPVQLNSLIYTLMIALGGMTVLQILRQGVQGNDYYRLGRRPLAIGIAGDSATGKSTFENALLDLFGRSLSVSLSGDDYHNWDRSSPMWKSLTHLDPRANRLAQLAGDVRRILDGESVRVGEYDHSVGRFLPAARRKSRNVVIVSGLHTLYARAIADDMDAKFFLRMNNDLRLALKTRRDMQHRGHEEAKVREVVKRREPDSQQFIEPQAERAGVVFNLQPVNPELLPDLTDARNIKLGVLIRNGVYVHDLIRILVGVCGLQVNIDRQDGAGAVEIEVAGEVTPEDISLASSLLLPHMDELIDGAHGFHGGILGVMQLIALAEIDESLKRRRRAHAAS